MPTKFTISYKVFRAIFYCVLMTWLMASANIAYAQLLDRQVELELVTVPGAKHYEVKVTPINLPDQKERTYSLTKTFFSERLPLGTWRFEVRSFDRRGIPGRWNPLEEVNIGFKAPTLISPMTNTIFKILEGNGIPVNFKWNSFSPLASYTISILNAEDKTIVVKEKAKGGSFDATLPAGQYSWTVAPVLPPGVSIYGELPASSNFTVLAPKLGDPVIDKFAKTPPKIISWKKVDKAENYDVSLHRIKEADSKEIIPPTEILKKNIVENSIAIPENLDSGFYKFKVFANAKNFESSNERFIQYRIREKPPVTKPTDATPSVKDPAKPAKEELPHHVPVNFLQGSMGPTFWKYNFNAEGGQNFNLFAATVTAISADLTKWVSIKQKYAWGLEVRGRQTNIYLFDPPTGDPPDQGKLTVADRRIAGIVRRRSIHDRIGIDLIVGFGTHHYTYVIQSESQTILTAIYGDLLEFYIGGAADWQLLNGNHVSFDLTFHPVSSSVGISALKTLQYTSTLRYVKNIFHERINLSLNLENISSKVTTNSDRYKGNATTTNTWYRFGAGIAIKI